MPKPGHERRGIRRPVPKGQLLCEDFGIAEAMP